MADQDENVALPGLEEVPALVVILPEPKPVAEPRIEVDLFADRPRVFLARVKIEPFQVMPEILLWQGRTFVPMEGCATPSYREAICVFVPAEVG